MCVETMLDRRRQVNVISRPIRPQLAMVSVFRRMTVPIESKENAQPSEQNEEEPDMSLFQDRAK